MGRQARDLTGQTFNELTAIKVVDKPIGCNQYGLFWLFRCSCGASVTARGAQVTGGGTKSCGHIKSEACSRSSKNRILRDFGTADYRFESRIDKSGDCWIFTGGKDKNGYGLISNGHRKTALRAHRYSYEKYNGQIPHGYVVRHTCDNPSCVNPSHLITGTPKDNVSDMLIRGRDAMVGSRNNKAKLTELDVIDILTKHKGRSRIVLAEMYGVSISTISSIRSRKTWGHLDVSA